MQRKNGACRLDRRATSSGSGAKREDQGELALLRARRGAAVSVGEADQRCLPHRELDAELLSLWVRPTSASLPCRALTPLGSHRAPR